MAITLSYGGVSVDLTDRLDWTDEFAWSPVVQALSYSTEGALMVDVGVRQAGRPITLEGTDTQAWISRATCEAVAAWAALPGIALTLVLRGLAREVMFDHSRTGFEARSMWRLADGHQTPDQVYLPTLRFVEI